VIPVTVDQFLGPYLKHPEVTEEKRVRIATYLVIANAALAKAEEDGVVLEINPHTGCYLAGVGNGGWRPSDCLIGAPDSAHKHEEAGDWYDTMPERVLCRWSLRNQEYLRSVGILAMENPQWTGTLGTSSWAHWQTRPLKSGNFVFVPNRTPALVKLLPEQVVDQTA